MNKSVEGKLPEKLIEMVRAPGVILVYGPEASGKSTLVMYLLSQTVSPEDRVLLYDSSNAVEIFRRLVSKVGEGFAKKVFRIPVRDWEDQKRWVLKLSFMPKGFKKVVFDEFTFPYLLELLKIKDSIKRYMKLHRELIFQVAYLRYLSETSSQTIFLIATEGSTGDPLGGVSLKKISSLSIKLHKVKGELFHLEVEGEGDGTSKIIFWLDP